MTVPRTIALDTLEFAEYVRPGDGVVWNQVTGEPVPLSERLMAQRAAIGGRFGVFLVANFSTTVAP